MPGRRLKSFRSGDLNEHLGVLLLKSFAAVAEVARQEDVGIDAVATLLREDDKGMLVAEDSFYVQLKSASERSISYTGHEVKWLTELKLPLFIGSVDRKTSSMSLYTTHRLSQVLVEANYSEIHLDLDHARPEASAHARYACIDPPVLQWSMKDLSDDAFPDHAYAVLKPMIRAEQKNIDYRGIRYVEPIKWTTNEVPSIDDGGHMTMGKTGDTDELKAILKSMCPQIYALAGRFHSDKDEASYDLLLTFMELMRRHGVDPDTRGVYRILRQHLHLPPDDEPTHD